MSAAPEEAATSGDQFVKFGDICVFRDNNTKSYLACPLATSHHSNLVVYTDQLANGGGVPGSSFSACQFQIVAEEKSRWGATLGKAMSKLQHQKAKQRDRNLREARRAAAAKKAQAGSDPRISSLLLDHGANPTDHVETFGFGGGANGSNAKGPDDHSEVVAEILPEADMDDLLGDESLRIDREMALAEMRDNDLTQARQFGFPLHYGDVVQLWQPYQRKFIRASSSAVAQLEPSNMKVSLDPKGGGATHFTIMPRYKIRSVGDIIKVDDEIVFESIKSESQYLSISNDVLPCVENGGTGTSSLYPVPNCHEVSLSVNQSSFEIGLFNRPVAYSMRQYGATIERLLAPAPPITKGYDDTSIEPSLTAGMVVQLFHKDSESFISAEGSPVNGFLNGPNTPSLDVHLRNRVVDPDRPNRLLPPTSAVTYFEIELSEQPSSGGVINWNTSIRIKHVPTQLYLCLDSGKSAEKDTYYPMTLKSLPDIMKEIATKRSGPGTAVFDAKSDPSAFQLYSEIGASTAVPIDAFLRLQHKMTGCWVHAGTSAEQTIVRPTGDRGGGSDSSHADDSFGSKIGKVVWDQAPLFSLVLTKEKETPDAFSVRKVPDELVYFVNYVIGFIPILHRFTNIRSQRELRPTEAEELARELNELNSFMYYKGIEQKKRQKLLRSLQVIEALIAMLKAPFANEQGASGSETTFGFPSNSPTRGNGHAKSLGSASGNGGHLLQNYDDVTHPGHRNTQIVMVNVFRVLRSFLTGQARKNEMYMAAHVPFLWRLFGTNMKVEPMFNELVLDNINLVHTFGKPEIQKVVQFLRHGDKNADYLQLFSALCVCEGEPNRFHQKLIGEELLNNNSPPVFLTDVVGLGTKRSGSGWSMPSSKAPTGSVKKKDKVDEKKTVKVRISEEDTGTDMNEFVHSALDEDDQTSTPEYMFLQRQLELYGNLCLGRNQRNITLIVDTHKHLTWEECFLCATANSALDASGKTATRDKSDMLLPRSLRLIYVNLIVNVFVDVGENRDVCTDAELSYDYAELKKSYYVEAAREQTKALSGAEFVHFSVVKDWIRGQLQQVTSMVHRDAFEGQAKNRLLGAILNLLSTLIRFGYYIDEKDINALMTPLQSVLSGLNDFNMRADQEGDKSLKRWRMTKRYEMDDDGRAVMEAKLKALLCIDSLFNYVFNVRLRFLLADYKNLTDQSVKRNVSLNTDHKAVSKSALAPLKALLAIRDEIVRDAQGVENVDVEAALEKHNDQICAVRQGVAEYLQIITDDCDYVTTGWDVNSSHISSKEGHPTLVQILLDTARYDYYPLLTRALQLVDKIYSAESDVTACAVAANVALTPDSVMLAKQLDTDTSTLTRDTTGVLAEGHADHVIKLLKYYTAMCSVSSAQVNGARNCELNLVDPGAPHFMNQQNSFNSGMITIVINIIDTPNQPGDVLAACFDCARAHAAGYPEVQIKLFENLNQILGVSSRSTTHGSLGTWQQSMGLCIAEIFNNCKDTCLGVRPGQVSQMLDLLIEFNSSAPSFVDALEAVAKVEEFNLPLPRNQGLIIKSLMSHKEAVMVQAFIDDKSSTAVNKQRLDCLLDHKGDAEKMKAQTYHLALVSLLGSICEGENQQIEATCRSIFSLEELLETITSKSIPHSNKGPYIKFLLWVYLNAAASKVSIGTDVLDADVEIFEAFAKIGREELESYYKKGAPAKLEMALFAFDAYIPCLDKLMDRHATALHRTQVAAIAATLTSFVGNLMETPTAHMHKFRCFAFVRCMEGIHKFMEKHSLARPVGYDKIKGWVANLGVQLDAGVHVDHTMAVYRGKYAEEKKLNDELNIFSQMLYRSYKGRNTIKDQLQIANPSSHLVAQLAAHENTSLAYTDERATDQAVPLGSEFQRFLTILTDPERNASKQCWLNPVVMNLCVRLWVGSMVYQASVSSQDRETNDRVVTKLMQAVRAKCHNENILRNSTTSVQKQIVDANAVLAVTGLISSNNRDLRQEALAMIVAILNNGYGEAQKAYTMYFLGTREEAFFCDIAGLIRVSSDSILELRALREQKKIADQKQDELRRTMTMTVNGGHQMAKMTRVQADTYGSMPDAAVQLGGVNPADIQVDVKVSNTALDFHDPGNIRLVLNVLQTMCEGHNTILQDYLRTQPDNVIQFNLIAQVAKFMERIRVDATNGDRMAKKILMQTLECMTEFAQGNSANQKEIFDARVTDSINSMIRESLIQSEFGFPHATGGEPPKNLDRTTDWLADAKCAELLLAQLATNDDVSRYLAKELTKVLDLAGVLQKIRYYRGIKVSEKEALKMEQEPGMPWEPETIAYTYFATLKRLRDFSGHDYHSDTLMLKADHRQLQSYRAFKKIGKKHRGDGHVSVEPLTKVYNDLDRTSECIEVMMHGRLQKVHFKVPDQWKEQLQEEVKNQLLWTVDRTSTNDGVRDFTDRCKVIIADMKYVQQMMAFSWVTSSLVKSKAMLHTSVLVVTFLLNLMILVFWDSKPTRWDSVPKYYRLTEDTYNLVFGILSIIHNVLAVLIMLVYFLNYPPSFRALKDSIYGLMFGTEALEKRRKGAVNTFLKSTDDEVFHAVKVDDYDDDDDGDVEQNVAEEEDTTVDPRQEQVFTTQANIGYLQEHDLIPRTLHRTQTSPFSGMSLYYVVFTTLSILGPYTYGYTFAFHLFHVIIGNQTLSRVIRSVTKNGVTLLYVAGLLIIIIYVYSLIVFAVLRDHMDPVDAMFCDNMLECFLTSVKYGLLTGGGLGEAIPEFMDKYQNTGVLFARFAFDITFFVLVTLIGLNVVFGIIVDTFSELRDEKYQIQEAMDTECFICGRSSNDLDRKSDNGDFRFHVKHEHKMWNFLFFFYHLDQKDATEYDDIEQFIAEQVYTNQYDFYPIGKALGLEKSDALQASGDDQVRDLRTELNAFRQEMVDRLTAMTKALGSNAEF